MLPDWPQVPSEAEVPEVPEVSEVVATEAAMRVGSARMWVDVQDALFLEPRKAAFFWSNGWLCPTNMIIPPNLLFSASLFFNNVSASTGSMQPNAAKKANDKNNSLSGKNGPTLPLAKSKWPFGPPG